MPEYTLKHNVRYHPDEMFDLVSDVESYPSFVPTISALRKKSCGKEKDSIFIAEALIRYKFLKEQFSTKVCLKKEIHTISVSLISGPFKVLKNEWSFEDSPDRGCLVHFWIHYEFNNKVLDFILQNTFSYAVKRLMTAFEEEAKRRYSSSISN